VYGFIHQDTRMGLIQVLIMNGLLRKSSTIYGTLDTLRDYVFVGDIALFTIDILKIRHIESDLFHLSSGKPTSISQIKHIIERLISRQLLLSFSKDLTNALDIPCVVNNYNGLWQPSSLEVNIKRIYQEQLN